MQRSKVTFYFFVGLLFFSVISTYSNHFFNGFHFDDFHTITNNAYVQNIKNIPLFFKNATTFSSLPSNQSYRPIVSTSLAIDYFVGKGGVFFFHFSMFFIFLLQGVLMFFLFKKIFNNSLRKDNNQFIALAAVAFYMLHPANAETINYMIARSDSFSAFFMLLAFVMYANWDFGKRYFLYLIPFVLGCLTKPIGGIFAILLILYIYLFETQKSSEIIKKSLPILITCVLTMLFIKKMEVPTWHPGGASMLHYVITQPFVILHYFITFFAPISLSADTDWTTLQSFLDIRLLIGLVFIVILLITSFVATKDDKYKPIAFGFLWFFITLVPTSLIPLSEVTNDHRMFLPFVGLALSISWAIALFLENIKRFFVAEKIFSFTVIVMIIFILSAYAYGTWVRNGVWLDEKTLWLDVTQKSPENPRGLMNYGLTLMAEADYDGAERYFMRALKLAPNYSYLLINIGIVQEAKKMPVVAEEYFKRAISLDPSRPAVYYYYGLFLEKQSRKLEAIEQIYKALQLAPADLESRHTLMQLYFEQNEKDKLYQLAQETLQIMRDDAVAKKYLTGEK